MGVLGIMICPLGHTLIMVHAVVVICIVKLSIMQEAQLGTMMAKVVMPIVHKAIARGIAIMGSWAHVDVVALTSAQDAVVPLGTLLVNVIGAILFALATVEPLLTLTPPVIQCVLIALLLGHASDWGIVNEGGANSTMITPCCSSSVAVVGTVVVMSLITSLNGVINMATMVCSG
jgi:fluoride ion exporter CrcB/FEX